MKILIDINHPAHVHLLKNTYGLLSRSGNDVIVTVKDIPSAIELLNIYHIPYIHLGKKNDGILHKGIDQIRYDFELYKLAKERHVELMLGSSMTIAHVGWLTGTPSIVLDDDDDAAEPLFARFAHPFADVVMTPDAIVRKTKKAIYYSGTHELAYLHPNYFTPDETVIRQLGLTLSEPFFVLRFNAFKAHHDIGKGGLTIEHKRQLVALLSEKGRVFITTEREIDHEFEKYQLRISADKIHSLLFYATMFVGDSQTMTSEAAILGTPALKCNSFAGKLAVPNQLEQNYGLCYSFQQDRVDDMFAKITELLSMPNLKQEWKRRRDIMLSEKIDVTAFFTWFVENYPQSAKVMHDNPDYQWHFR